MKYSKELDDLSEEDLYAAIDYVGNKRVLRLLADHPNATETIRRLILMKINEFK